MGSTGDPDDILKGTVVTGKATSGTAVLLWTVEGESHIFNFDIPSFKKFKQNRTRWWAAEGGPEAPAGISSKDEPCEQWEETRLGAWWGEVTPHH